MRAGRKNFLSLPFAGSSGFGVLLFVSFLVTAEVVVLDQLKSNRIGPDRIGLDDGYATAGAIEMSFTDLLVARMYTVRCTSSSFLFSLPRLQQADEIKIKFKTFRSM